MTIGSAASLPGFAPAPPLPAFPSFRRTGRLTVVPRSTSPRAAPWRADDPPRGRILVVEDEALAALDLQRLLREAGYRAIGPAASIDDVEHLTRPRHRLPPARRPIDGAVVDLHLGGGGSAVAVADSLADRGIPFVWLTDGPFDVPPPTHAEAPAVARTALREHLVAALDRLLSADRETPHVGGYVVPPPQESWPRVFPQL